MAIPKSDSSIDVVEVNQNGISEALLYVGKKAKEKFPRLSD